MDARRGEVGAEGVAQGVDVDDAVAIVGLCDAGGVLLQEAAELDLGDHLEFRIASAKKQLPGASQGSASFPVDALLVGKTFGRFHINVGFGDPVQGEPDVMTGALAWTTTPSARLPSGTKKRPGAFMRARRWAHALAFACRSSVPMIRIVIA